MHSGKKALKTNLIFAGVLLLAALLLAVLANRRPPAAVAVLTYGEPQQTVELPLDENRVYHQDTGLLTVHIQVQNGRARFVDSPCPDHICEGYGWLSKDGDWAACLPARASLMVCADE